MKILHEYRFYLIVIILAFLLRTFVFRISFVHGQSMEPTLHDKNILFCTIFDRYNLKHGDIIIIKAPTENKLYIKRVIALPNDTLVLENEDVIVNGTKLDEKYIKNTTHYYTNSMTLASNEYFVLGDNRDHSDDSRYFGPIDKDSIIAKVKLKIF